MGAYLSVLFAKVVDWTMNAREPCFTGWGFERTLGSDLSAGLLTVVSSLKLFLLASTSMSAVRDAILLIPIILLLLLNDFLSSSMLSCRFLNTSCFLSSKSMVDSR